MQETGVNPGDFDDDDGGGLVSNQLFSVFFELLTMKQSLHFMELEVAVLIYISMNVPMWVVFNLKLVKWKSS